jgi:hypothetical protein
LNLATYEEHGRREHPEKVDFNQIAQYTIRVAYTDDCESYEVASRWANHMLRMMEGVNCSIGFNVINGQVAQFYDMDNAPTKKAVCDRIISSITKDSNCCAFELAVVTDYLMTNFCYQLRPDMGNIDPLIVTDHSNFIGKKGPTERTITYKKQRAFLLVTLRTAT